MFPRALLVIAGLLLVVGAGTLAAAPTPEAPESAALGPNLLFNPSFEGYHDYSAYVPPGGHPDCPSGTCGTAQMAPGWIPYWRSHNNQDPGWIIRMPEYKPADPQWTDPRRVRTGTAAQAYFTFESNHEAGFYQQVSVTPGLSYCFSVWGHSWSANLDEDAYTDPPPNNGNFRQRVGIDPSGNTDWQSSTIVWGAVRVQPDFFEPFVVTATAQANTMTVYAYSFPEWAAKHNDAYWDDANLRQIEPVLPEGELLLVVPPGAAQTVSKTINANWLCDPETSWEVNLDEMGAFSPTVSASSGPTGGALTVTLNSTGLASGEHETTLYFTSPDTTRPIAAIPARIVMLSAEHNLFLPTVIRGE
jgi:hypothetical protein